MNAKILEKNAQAICHFTEKRSTKPILERVRIAQTGDGLSLTASDLESSIQIYSDAEGEPFEACVNASILKNALAGETGAVNLSHVNGEKNHLNISLEDSLYEIPSISVEDYPSTPPLLDDGASITLPASLLLERISQVVPWASLDQTRYNINGALFEIQNSRLRIVATNGHAVGFADLDLGDNVSSGIELFLRNQEQTILHRRCLEKLCAVIKLFKPNHIRISRVEDFINFSFDANDSNIYVSIREVDGRFPDYLQVVPRETYHEMSLPYEFLEKALKKLERISSDESRGLIINCECGQLETSSPEFGRLQIALPDGCFTGQSKEQLGISGKYLRMALDVFKKSERIMVFRFNNNLSPYQIDTGHDSPVTVITMPLRYE